MSASNNQKNEVFETMLSTIASTSQIFRNKSNKRYTKLLHKKNGNILLKEIKMQINERMYYINPPQIKLYFQCNPNQNSNCVCVRETERADTQVLIKCNRPRIAKTKKHKENKVGGLTLPISKVYYKTSEIKPVCY